MMKVNIIYDSKYGNGEKVCKYMEELLEDGGHSTDLYFIRKTKMKDVPEADLYIVNSPTHFGSAPWKIKRYLKKLPAEGARFALITTCLDEESKALDKMRERIKGKDLEEVGSGLKIKVEGMKGPLEEGYREKIQGFLDEILSEM